MKLRELFNREVPFDFVDFYIYKSKIIDGDFMITETERLFLRELTKDDFSALYFGRFGYNATLSIYI